MRSTVEVAVLTALAIASASAAGWILWRFRRDPAERERRRRALIAARGRLIEGLVTDFLDGVVYYSYSWRGVDYEASQDLRSISADLPHSSDLLVGPVTVKFLAGDPSSSIVFSETWSGFPRYRLVQERAAL